SQAHDSPILLECPESCPIICMEEDLSLIVGYPNMAPKAHSKRRAQSNVLLNSTSLMQILLYMILKDKAHNQ
ncbi:hypothetical protein ACJX0J_014433, partial [Zea mays]